MYYLILSFIKERTIIAERKGVPALIKYLKEIQKDGAVGIRIKKNSISTFHIWNNDSNIYPLVSITNEKEFNNSNWEEITDTIWGYFLCHWAKYLLFIC